ncbi:hypothetical protein [Streptomyces sp. NPDC058385]|uniref:hypothetical protein n=1 Tax=Streptomyces sp. NPDC058385 TaxID=3346473 RepID=UPI00365005DF
MNNLAKRVSAAVATLTLVGGAVLGVGGSASAATLTPEHAQRATISNVAGDQHSSRASHHGWERGEHHRSDRDHNHNHHGARGDHHETRADHRPGDTHDRHEGGDQEHRCDRHNKYRWDNGVSYLWDGRTVRAHRYDRHTECR